MPDEVVVIHVGLEPLAGVGRVLQTHVGKNHSSEWECGIRSRSGIEPVEAWRWWLPNKGRSGCPNALILLCESIGLIPCYVVVCSAWLQVPAQGEVGVETWTPQLTPQ